MIILTSVFFLAGAALNEPPRTAITLGSISTPEDRTEPIIDYTCRAETIAGKRIEFAVRYVGGRGYKNPQSNEIEATDASASFSGRDGALFAPYKITAWRHKINGRSDDAKAPFGQWIAVSFERTQMPYEETAPRRVGMLIHFESMPKLLRAVGYCDQAFTRQIPLDSAEVKELIKS